MSLVREGIKLISSSFKRKIIGHDRFKGNANQICRKITKKCWNGKYLKNSLGNYKEFWARDFGLSVDALIATGFKEEVKQTIKYALRKYYRFGKITTTIHGNGTLFNFPVKLYSPDSVAHLFYSLKKLKLNDLIKKYRIFLQNEVDKFFKKTLDKRTGLIKKEKYSSMRDFVATKGSCYDCVILFWMSKLAKELGFNAPKLDLNKFIKKYWNGEYFNNGIEEKHFAVDANVMPFWTGLVKNKKKFEKVILKIEKEKLNEPLSLKYTNYTKEKHISYEILSPSWERNKVWSNVGLMYMLLLAKSDKKRCMKEIKKYEKIIKKQGTMYECYTETKPYRSLLYFSDDGMMWCINLSYIIKLFNSKK